MGIFTIVLSLLFNLNMGIYAQKTETKPEIKQNVKPELKPEVKKEVKQEVKTVVKAEVPEPKLEIKATTTALQSAQTTETKPEIKPEIKPVVKTEPQKKEIILERETIELIDENGDGIAEIKKYYNLNEDGERILIKKEIDISGDGKVDYIVNYKNKKPGDDKIEIILVDNDFDGKFDEKRFYSENGQLIKKELDLNFDSKPDLIKRYYSNELVKKEIDTNFDGVFDQWEYYQDGKLARIEIDTDGDGKPDKIGKTQIQEVYKFDLDEIQKAATQPNQLEPTKKKASTKKSLKKKKVKRKIPVKKKITTLPKQTVNQEITVQ